MKIESIHRPWDEKTTHRHNHRGDNSFYKTSAWRSTRDAFMAQHPKCIECGSPSQVCDHKVRIRDGGDALSWDNLQPMCHKCHNRKDNNAGKR